MKNTQGAAVRAQVGACPRFQSHAITACQGAA